MKTWKRFALWLGAVALAAAARAAESNVDPRTEEVFKRYEGRVVQVRVVEKTSGERTAVGSGFLVSSRGHAVTNFHVVSPLVWEPEDYRAEAVLASGATLPLVLINVDVVRDLALVKLDGEKLPFFELEPSTPLKGQRLYAMGNPHDLGLTIVEGTYSGLLEESLLQKLHFTGSVNPGMSGGPVLNREGRVVGVNVATAGNQVSFLVPKQFVRWMLASPPPEGAGVSLNAETAASTSALRARVQQQLVDHQDQVYAGLLAKPFETGDLGPFRAPARLSPAFHCWAKTESDAGAPYQSVHSECATEDFIFVTDDVEIGGLSLVHHSLASEKLNAFQFTALQADHFERMEGEDKRMLVSRLAGPPELTGPACASGFVDLNGIPAKASYCVQGYGRFPGLYDVRWRAASMAEGGRGFTAVVTLEGVSLENAHKFLKAYMGAFAWKK